MSEFDEKVVLITGAGQGIGRNIACAFAENGAIAAVNDLTPINLDATLAQIQSTGGKGKDYVFDVAKRIPAGVMVEQVVEDWGRIDILVNCAEVEPHDSILVMDEWDWRRTIDVNLSGAFFTMQSAGRIMRESGGGAIVNIAASFGNSQDQFFRPAYIASKMGLIGLTREAAREFKPFKIRVNAVCPSLIEQNMQTPDPPDDQAARSMLEELSRQQTRRADAVISQVMVLCSGEPSHLTGQVITEDGKQVEY